MKGILEFVFSSKTLIFIFVMTVLLVISFIVVAAAINLGLQVPVTSEQLIEAWKWATGAGTARNVISDGVMPRIPQAVGAINNPSVAVESPKSMTLSEPPVTDTNSPFIPSQPSTSVVVQPQGG